MNNYTANDISTFFQQYDPWVTHYAVLQSEWRPYGLPQSIINKYIAKVKNELHYALNIFAKLLYPTNTNYPIRKPYCYRPLTFVTIEGARETNDPEQTIHANICLGNIPKHLTATHIEIYLRYAWHVRAKQPNDIFVESIKDYPSDTGRLFRYVVKEGQTDRSKAWSTDGIWDVENCWIPHQALAAD